MFCNPHKSNIVNRHVCPEFFSKLNLKKICFIYFLHGKIILIFSSVTLFSGFWVHKSGHKLQSIRYLILFKFWKASDSYITKCLTLIHGKEAVRELGKILTITLHLTDLIYSQLPESGSYLKVHCPFNHCSTMLENVCVQMFGTDLCFACYVNLF